MIRAKTPDKFKTLQSLGLTLHPQDGSGITNNTNRLIVSGAIEETVPDIAVAKEQGIEIKTRAAILAALFNNYQTGISIAGTSGKSTTTGMAATIFDHAHKDPTVMNGAIIENFKGAKIASPFPNMRIGKSDIFITETDESDGSIALYNPAIAAVNNIALDHMPLTELQTIFLDFINRTTQCAVLNMDDPHIRNMQKQIKSPVKSYAITHDADLKAENIQTRPDGVSFTVAGHTITLKVPGQHNVLNALAALSIAEVCGIDLATAIAGIEKFTGIARRMQIIGTHNDITIIDDFAHNPDKITASLKTLREFDGRLIIMFQMHGFGPIKLMGDEIIKAFAEGLNPDDQLIMPEVYYAGGTVDRSKTAKDMIALARDKGMKAYWFEDRAGVKNHILSQVEPHDRIIIMGARDDSLTDFAKDIMAQLPR